jgi:hypothetical protein
MQCPYCQTINQSDSRFCTACGRRLTTASIGPEPQLTTRQVAALCSTTESTIRYSARVGHLHGVKTGSGWRFDRVEAERFRDAWRIEKKKKSKKRLVTGPLRRKLHRLRIQGIGFINLSASIISLASVIQFDRFQLAGIGFAVLNFFAAVFHFVAFWRRRPRDDDFVRDEPIDTAAIDWYRYGSGAPARQKWQTASVLTTAVFVGVVFGLGPGNAEVTDAPVAATSTSVPTVTRSFLRAALPPTPTPTPTSLPPRTTQLVRIDGPAADEPDRPRPTDVPTSTWEPTPTFAPSPTPSPSPTFTPPPTEPDAPQDDVGDPATKTPFFNPDEGAAVDPNQKAKLTEPEPTPDPNEVQ